MACQRSMTHIEGERKDGVPKKHDPKKIWAHEGSQIKKREKLAIFNKFKKREKSYLELTSFTFIFSIPYTCTLDHGCMNCLLSLIQSFTLQNVWCKYSFSIKEHVFLPKIIKTPDVKLSKESSVLWIILILNHQRKGDCQGPMETNVKRVSNLLPTYSIWERMLCCRICTFKKWDVAVTPDQQLKVWLCFGTSKVQLEWSCWRSLPTNSERQ